MTKQNDNFRMKDENYTHARILKNTNHKKLYARTLYTHLILHPKYDLYTCMYNIYFLG